MVAAGIRPATSPRIDQRVTDIGLLILRIVFGGLFAAAGAQKLFGWFGGMSLAENGFMFEAIGYQPGVLFAVIAGLLELVGGLLLLLGLFTPLASAIVLGVMINAVSATWSAGLFAMDGYQMALLYATVGAAFAFTGAGAFALDHGRPWQRHGARWALISIGLGIASAIGTLAMKVLL